jgi:hypothetical protein
MPSHISIIGEAFVAPGDCAEDRLVMLLHVLAGSPSVYGLQYRFKDSLTSIPKADQKSSDNGRRNAYYSRLS